MFRADLAWAGPVLGVAVLALRTYLKGRSAMADSEIDPRLALLRDLVWEQREEHLDLILLHDCEQHEQAKAMIWAVGWDLNTFVLAALHGMRRELGD